MRFRAAREQVADRADGWELERDDVDALGGGLGKTYGRACAALAEARERGSTEALHELRKRVEYHLHHVRLVRTAREPALVLRREALPPAP